MAIINKLEPCEKFLAFFFINMSISFVNFRNKFPKSKSLYKFYLIITYPM